MGNVHLRVDAGSFKAAMTEKIGDGLERSSFFEHARGPSMAQGVAAMVRRGYACLRKRTSHQLGNRRHCDGLKRWSNVQKNTPAAGLWTTTAEVGQYRLPNGGHKWDLARSSSLEGYEGDPVVSPENVTQGKQANLLGTHPIGEQELQDCVVSLPNNGGAVWRIKQSFCLLPLGATR